MVDTDAITQTVRDYFESWYEADPARMDRALHPNLVKRRGTAELNIASVTVRTSVYYEYIHLVRGDEGWRIANTLWQLTSG